MIPELELLYQCRFAVGETAPAMLLRKRRAKVCPMSRRRIRAVELSKGRARHLQFRPNEQHIQVRRVDGREEHVDLMNRRVWLAIVSG